MPDLTRSKSCPMIIAVAALCIIVIVAVIAVGRFSAYPAWILKAAAASAAAAAVFMEFTKRRCAWLAAQVIRRFALYVLLIIAVFFGVALSAIAIREFFGAHLAIPVIAIFMLAVAASLARHHRTFHREPSSGREPRWLVIASDAPAYLIIGAILYAVVASVID